MIRKASEKEFDLCRSEIKKIYAAAKRRNPGTMVELESWFGTISDDLWQTIECHMMDGLTGERLDDVEINCCMFDRRQSFVTMTIKEINKKGRKTA